ncbi:MAG: MW1434 family type I TA system toxin, partial [Lacticaseibacillus paracasei]
MTFEAILPSLKARKKAVRTGWEGTELYVQLVPEGKFEG